MKIDPLLRAKAVTIVRDGKNLLSSIDIDFSVGRFSVILGPSGAGKSTLLKTLTGEWSTQSGTIEFCGQRLSHWPPAELARRRAVLAQESQITFPLTVREVILQGAYSLRSTRREELTRRIDQLLHEMDLPDFAERIFPTLSGGEKQRVHLARNLLQLSEGDLHGKILFLDEPVSSLDPGHQHTILTVVKSRVQHGLTVIAILHDLNLAMQYGDHAWIMQSGRWIAQGPLPDCLTPATIKAAYGINAHWLPIPNQDRPHLCLLPLH